MNGEWLRARGAWRAVFGGLSTSPLAWATMLHRLIALVLLSALAAAADFRTLNFRDLCAGVEEKEQTLGPISLPQKETLGVHAFQVRAYNRDVFMNYFCPKASLFTNHYAFPIEQFDDAVRTYRHTNGRLVSIYGSPVLDPPPSLVGTNTESLVGGPDRTKYSGAWRTSHAFVTISIMPNQPSEVSGWRVFGVMEQASK